MKGAAKRRSGHRAKKKKDYSKLCISPPKILFREPIGRELPSSLHKFRWNVDKVERKLQEKIQEKTQIAGNFLFQQAYRLLEGNRGEGIDFPSFREQLRIKFGILLNDDELQLLFNKYDEDGNGTIDIHEFIRRVLPPDYNYGCQWFEVSQLEHEEKVARLKHEARLEFLACQGVAISEHLTNMGTTSNWTIETLKRQIQAKVVQKTPSGEDQYRRAFKMLRSGRNQGIRMSGLQFNLKTKFGIYASDEQMRQLFSLCDQDHNGEIDLQEFLQFVDPPAYPNNSRVPGGIWTQSDSEDDDESIVSNEIAEAPVTPAFWSRSRPDSASPSVQDASCRVLLSSMSSEDGSLTGLPPTRIRKERPKTADPRKTKMLQKRREMADAERMKCLSARESLYSTNSISLGDIHNTHPEEFSLPQEGEILSAQPFLHISASRPRAATSVRSEVDSASIANRSNGAYTARPQSAGSVRSYGAPSVGSVSSTVRGAAYMKRPPTPQWLRQKCYESRGMFAEEPGEVPTNTRKKRAPMGAPQTVAQQLLRPNRVPRACNTERRHSCSEINECNCADEDRYAPRIVRVHQKQYNTRPYSAEGRVFRRSKVLSSGCI